MFFRDINNVSYDDVFECIFESLFYESGIGWSYSFEGVKQDFIKIIRIILNLINI